MSADQKTTSSRTARKKNVSSSTHKTSDMELIREALDKDRKRTPISNAILRCEQPEDISVVITLRTANLRDLTLAELHKNNVRVVGKVTRLVEAEQSIGAFENYGMSLIQPEILEPIFEKIAKTDGIVAEFSEIRVQGPTVQILPMMIFV